jgi:hypothetical protein
MPYGAKETRKPTGPIGHQMWTRPLDPSLPKPKIALKGAAKALLAEVYTRLRTGLLQTLTRAAGWAVPTPSFTLH